MAAAQLGFLAMLVVAATVMALLMADAFLPESRRSWLALVGGAGITLALVLEIAATVGGIATPGAVRLMFNDAIAVDAFGVFFQVVFLGVGLLVMVLSPSYLERQGAHRGEYYVLVVAALAGMMLLVSATNLITIFLGVELLSIPLYILSAFLRHSEASQEAGMKYLLVGGFASGFLLYGLAMLFGGTGTTSVRQIALELPHLQGDALTFSLIGIALVLVGLAFKASAAPFHTWTPDVYEGAPAPVVAFMSVGTKVAAVAAFLRLFDFGLAAPAASERWVPLLGAVAALSMIVGAAGALGQDKLRRLLAYSSIAQAGYLLLAVVAGGRAGLVGGLFFLAAYAVMAFGAFGMVSVLGAAGGPGTVTGLRGLGYKSPLAGGLLALFMLSLAGIPATIGFWGKLFVFQAAIARGYGALAVVAIVASAVSLYYYFRVVVQLYTPADNDAPAPKLAPAAVAAVSFAGALTLLVGLFPAILYDVALRATLI